MSTLKNITLIKTAVLSFALSITPGNAAFDSYLLRNQQTKQVLSVFLLSNPTSQGHLHNLLEKSFVPFMKSEEPTMYWYFFIESKDQTFCNRVEELMQTYIKKMLPPNAPPYERIIASQVTRCKLQEWLTYRFIVCDQCEDFLPLNVKENREPATSQIPSDLQKHLNITINYEFIQERKHLILLMIYAEEKGSRCLKRDNFPPALLKALALLNFTCPLNKVGARVSIPHKREEMKKELRTECNNFSCNSINLKNPIRCNLCKEATYCSFQCKRAHWKKEHRKKHTLYNQFLFKNAAIFLNDQPL